ncbi:hypothetical protein C8J57DRAFT_1484711 [Mycena rebaudengoi]|nr:hypothetical protein C8J57DRAFT_1484711 [Mycena rebaudengoi]
MSLNQESAHWSRSRRIRQHWSTPRGWTAQQSSGRTMKHRNSYWRGTRLRCRSETSPADGILAENKSRWPLSQMKNWNADSERPWCQIRQRAAKVNVSQPHGSRQHGACCIANSTPPTCRSHVEMGSATGWDMDCWIEFANDRHRLRRQGKSRVEEWEECEWGDHASERSVGTGTDHRSLWLTLGYPDELWDETGYRVVPANGFSIGEPWLLLSEPQDVGENRDAIHCGEKVSIYNA